MKAVFSSSVLVLACVGWASFADLERELARAQTAQEAQKIMRDNPPANADRPWRALSRDFLAEEAPPEYRLEQLRRQAAARAVAERIGGAQQPGVKGQVERIKRARTYSDPGVAHESNWLQRVIQRAADALRRDPSQRTPPAVPSASAPGWDLSWLVTVAWVLLVLLATAAVGALIFLLRGAGLGKWRLRRQVAMLGEDEPLRAADEWLVEADRLEAEGKYRDAVRCLYLACLMRLDQARVAAFIRGETNWEHCQRVTASPTRPAGLDFVPPTRAFDRVWYGGEVRGQIDVADFRRTYTQLCEQIAARKIA